MRQKQLTAACILTAMVLALLPSAAFGEGSPTVAGAPTIVFGQQEFGTTVGGTHLGKPSGLASFWTLPTIAGDQITIDWEATLGSSTGIHLYPPNEINDYNDQEARTVAGQGQSDSGKNQLEHTAPTTGNMILAMVSNHASGATYSFIAYARHALTIRLPRIGVLPHRKTVAVAVHAPDGSEISNPELKVALEAKTNGIWQKLGSAPVKASVAKVTVKLPSSLWGRTIPLRATAAGPSYMTVRTSAAPVKVS